MSLPSRERGLKYLMQNTADGDIRVAPLAGAWIEIIDRRINCPRNRSLPSRERGLKFCYRRRI